MPHTRTLAVKSDLSMSERQEAITLALRKRLGLTELYVTELYDDRAIYTTYGEGENAGKSWEVGYSFDDAGAVTLADEVTEVQRRTVYRAVKFADGSDSIIEGLAIPYGGSIHGKDLHGESFGPETDLALDWFPQEGRPFLFQHGIDEAVKTSVVGRQTEREARDIGQWVKVQLDKRHKYMDAVRELVDQEALSFSSGAMPHLVRTRKDGFIERWPWVELSGTPTPAEPGASVYAVKSFDLIDHLVAVEARTALRSLMDLNTKGSGSEPFDTHAERVASEVEGLVERAKTRIDLRAAKAGRELSSSNREWLRTLHERLGSIDELRREVKEALDRTDPDARKATELLEVELLVSELRRTGVLD